MKDCKFKSLVIDAYNLKQNSNNLVGILYNAISTHGFNDIIDIQDYMDNLNPDMLHLKSKVNNVEIDIYEYELENYTIKNSEQTLYVKLKNKSEIAVMF